MKRFAIYSVFVLPIILVCAVSLVYGQPGRANVKIGDVKQLEQAVADLTNRLGNAENSLTAANNRILVLEKEDKIQIKQFLGTRNSDGTYPSANIDIIDTDGSASVSTTIPQGTSAPTR
jgi:hypothetical protein